MDTWKTTKMRGYLRVIFCFFARVLILRKGGNLVAPIKLRLNLLTDLTRAHTQLSLGVIFSKSSQGNEERREGHIHLSILGGNLR